MQSWPNELPKSPTLEGYNEGAANNRLVSNPDQGATKIRRRFTATPTPVTERYVLNKQQVKKFKEWYYDDIKGGSLLFTKYHPIIQEDKVYRFAPDSTFSLSTLGIMFELNIELEVMPE